VMWGVDSTDGGYWIGGLIIDRRHQRRGYGRAAVLELLERAALAGIAKPRATTRRTGALGPRTQTWASSRPASSKTAKP
jgi:GNAT superfamily N-acetyltransferase